MGAIPSPRPDRGTASDCPPRARLIIVRGRMQKYIARRLLLAIPTIFGVTVVIFLVMRVLPRRTR